MGYKTSLSNHLDRSMSASTGKTRVQYQPYHFHTDSSPIQSSTPDTTLKSIAIIANNPSTSPVHAASPLKPLPPHSSTYSYSSYPTPPHPHPSSTSPALTDRTAPPYHPLDISSAPSLPVYCMYVRTFREYLVGYILEFLLYVAEEVVDCVGEFRGGFGGWGGCGC